MNRVVIAIATPLESHFVPIIEAVDERVEVRYEPDLIPPARFPGDHVGPDDFHRSPEQQDRWRRMLEGVEVVCGIPGESGSGLTELLDAAPALRWVQTTGDDIDDRIRTAWHSAPQRDRVRVTSASGIHATPTAEFAMLGVLASARRMPELLDDRRARRWNPYPAGELAHRSLLLVGLGPAAVETARLAGCFGMEVMAINRTGRADVPGIEIVRPPRFLPDLLPAAHAVVVTAPLTDETRGLIGAAELARMRRDSVLISLGGADVIDRQALLEGLRSGQPGAAVIDSFAEPLPQDDPMWDMPNVLVTPHTASLSVRENARLITFFTDNLARYLRGEDLVNQV